MGYCIFWISIIWFSNLIIPTYKKNKFPFDLAIVETIFFIIGLFCGVYILK